MNIVKHKRNFIFLDKNILECDTNFILNIKNNMHSIYIFLFISKIKYKHNII